jgi:hypothetical protein
MTGGGGSSIAQGSAVCPTRPRPCRDRPEHQATRRHQRIREAKSAESLRMHSPVRRGDHIRIVSPGMPTLSYMPTRARPGRANAGRPGVYVSYGSRAFLIDDCRLPGRWDQVNVGFAMSMGPPVCH